jgi:hypothetical protein
MKRVPVAQQSVSRSHPFKDTVNTNLAAKIFSLFLRDRVILALFEHDAFLSIKTKLIKKLELLITPSSKTHLILEVGFVSDDHTSVQWFKRAYAATIIGEPFINVIIIS